MDETNRPRRVRADAERSTARIMDAATTVLAADPSASLERIADAAGLARATVHRRFSSRQALLDALVAQLNERYLKGLAEARVQTAPPLVALHRLTELIFELKVGHRFAMELAADPEGREPLLEPEVVDGLDALFTRLHESGEIAAADPAWCRRLYLVLLHEVHQLPAAAPELAAEAAEGVAARVDLLVRTLLGALGGTPARR
ncbi:helix-turn-helix domain-containing protein [Saccharopolyspora sp. NPDC047091]|uniref:TetR/AcrR family transcriptional regulator n=1 Tax=Saccharopolyspora sp. NPDC047091 TaxID=3155924 RepID=UPI0033CC687C